MNPLSDEAKRDIANKFELPERRSKIASLLKQNDEVYCICRSTDSTRFMIACDACDEWYHADCVHLTKSEADAIKVYYCPPCAASNPKLKAVYKCPRGAGMSKADRAKAAEAKKKREAASGSRPGKKVLGEKKAFRCTCDGQHRSKSCGKCSGCSRKVKCVEPVCVGRQATLSDEDYNSSNFSESDSDAAPVWAPPPAPKGRASQKSKDTKKKPAKKPVARSGAGTKRNNRKAAPVLAKKPEKESSSDEETVEFGLEPRQCLGPDCIELARPNSKFCGDFCGINLAHHRIYAILPHRQMEWMSPCVADMHNEVELAEVRQKYDEAVKEVERLVVKRNDLDNHIALVQAKVLDSDSSDEDHDEDGTMYCVTCGHEIAMKTCLKHMEKCFNKYEGKTTFGSVVKQGTIDGPPIFCDFYNPSSKTYCKRLAVLCAEHVKQPKLGDKELCGYPLNELTDKINPFGKYCRVRKKKCNTHFSWEKLRRASIDMQRVRMYSRIDELLDKDFKIRNAKKTRGSMMGLLLNSTFDHEKAEREVLKAAADGVAVAGGTSASTSTESGEKYKEVNLSESDEDEKSNSSSVTS